MKIERYTVTDTRKAAEKVKGKAYRFKELPDGTLVSRDPAFPLDGPKVVEKARTKLEKPTKEVKK